MSPDSVLLSIKLLFAGLIVLGVIFYMIRPMLRVVLKKLDVDLLRPDFVSRLEEQEELEIPSAELDPSQDKNAIIQQAKADPHATAALVRSWLKDRR